jgi:hypothetical protein
MIRNVMLNAIIINAGMTEEIAIVKLDVFLI